MPHRASRITTHDVAARAGVSQATVSLVLSGNPRARVSAETRARVQRVASELGYRPNLLARGLVQRRSFAIGVVVPDLGNPFYTDVVAGVERVAVDEGYAVLLCDAREIPAASHVEALRARLVDGLIIDAVGAASLAEETLRDLNVVLVDEPSERWPGVASDALLAGQLAGRHLLELGHRRLAFAGPATDVFAFRMRERGFVQVLREAGVELPSEALRRVPPTLAGGQAAIRTLLALRPRPTALFCANDLIALGALKGCLSAGVRVPDEFSLVGCDDIEMSRVVTPELSTVSIPARELGARAARLLLRRIQGADGGRAARPLPVHLAARGTTGPAPDPGEITA
jgi:LacI family transcriptional regulator